jgi:hypothetical protein
MHIRILSDINYKKISRTTFWINPKDKNKVIKGFQDLGLKIEVFDIIVKE